MIPIAREYYLKGKLFYIEIIGAIRGIHTSSATQRAELQSQIWKIANEVRGSVDGWDFKQYVLRILFYGFISENFVDYIDKLRAEIDKIIAEIER